MHLHLDAYAENTNLMTDKKLMAAWLTETVKVAGMTPFGKPYLQGFPWPGSQDWMALTAFQPLMESGLSVHCWPERKFVFIDLFTCGEMKEETEERVIGHIIRTFRISNPTIIILDRGVDSKTGTIIPARLRGV